MSNNLPDGRSPLAVAMQWASQVTTISVEMVVPILLGVWADRRWGTKAVFTILGAVAGLWLGLWSLLRLARAFNADDKKNGSTTKNKNQ
jgi:F0F1-type ATP synthase assembly protein I